MNSNSVFGRDLSSCQVRSSVAIENNRLHYQIKRNLLRDIPRASPQFAWAYSSTNCAGKHSGLPWAKKYFEHVPHSHGPLYLSFSFTSPVSMSRSTSFKQFLDNFKTSFEFGCSEFFKASSIEYSQYLLASLKLFSLRLTRPRFT